MSESKNNLIKVTHNNIADKKMSESKNQNLSSRSRKFCFTLNNYSCGDGDVIKSKFGIQYSCVGEEVAPSTGTKHLQGFIWFKNARTLKSVIKLFHKFNMKPHLEVAKGSVEQNIEYCSKEGKFQEYGEKPVKGKRTDIDALIQAVKEGATDIEIQEQFGECYLKYYKAIDRVRLNYKKAESESYIKEKFGEAKLRDWQKRIVKKLENQNDRQVTWVYDQKGGKGKTFLAKHLIANKGAFYVQNGKCSDVAYAYNYQEYVVFDFTRSQETYTNYSIIESMKNCILFSPKYESITKYFKECKVLVLSNFYPDTKKLSEDRWDIVDLDNFENKIENYLVEN